MALTIEQEQALLALLNEKKITLSELPAATGISEDDLMLIRQGILDKSVNSSVMKRHFTPTPASLTESGITKLSNAINSDDESIAATPKAVKLAYDLANSKLSTLPTASESTIGIVQLNNTTSSVSTTQAATANAVKKTYDFATMVNTTANNAAPMSTTINGKPLTDNITLTAQDIFNSQTFMLGPNQDLNTYLSAGLYGQAANANTSLALNYPEAQAGSLVVYKNAGITQVYYVYNCSRVYTRGYYGGVWSAWARDFNSLNVPTAAQLGLYTKAEVDSRVNARGSRDTGLKQQNGYLRFTDIGAYMQWGRVTAIKEGTQWISFPVAFPSACYSVVISVDAASTWPSNYVIYVTTRNTTGFNVYINGVGGKTIDFIAMGG